MNHIVLIAAICLLNEKQERGEEGGAGKDCRRSREKPPELFLGRSLDRKSVV